MYRLMILFGLLVTPFGPLCADDAEVAPATTDARGVRVHAVQSPYQGGPTKIHLLLPNDRSPKRRFPALFVLPVEAGDGRQWGDPVAEILRHDLPNKHGLICIVPTFSHLPWYADHPSDPAIRQESHLLHVVVPFVDRAYPTAAARNGRWLVGFSKSGYGALSLLLRHPETFGFAAAWDAPLMQQRPDRFGMGAIYGTQQNFQPYMISALIEQWAGRPDERLRLIHFGYGNFRRHHQSAHELMTQQGVPHTYRDGPARAHAWHSGWLPEAVGMLRDAAQAERR